MTIRVDHNIGDLATYLRRLAKEQKRQVRAVMKAEAEKSRKAIADEIRRRSKNSSGKLGRSFKSRVELKSGRASAIVESRSPYARIQNDGGTIRPRTGQFMTIPQTPSARRLAAKAWGNRLHRRGRGLFGPSGRHHFSLVRQVRLKGKGYMEAAMKRRRGQFSQSVGKALAVAIKRSRV